MINALRAVYVIKPCLELFVYVLMMMNFYLSQFQENEKKRYRAETLRFELKHQHQLEELRAAADTTIKELEQLQNEKSK